MRVRVLLVVSMMVMARGLVAPAFGVTMAIEPGNQEDHEKSPQWFFDIIVEDPAGLSANTVQITLSISGPGPVTLDGAASEAISIDPDYWVVGNSIGAGALDLSGGIYQFGDGPDSGIAELLEVDDIVARFVFDWTVEGWYTIDVDTNPLNTFVQDGNYVNQAVTVSNDLMMVYVVPEPGALLLLALGGLLARRRR